MVVVVVMVACHLHRCSTVAVNAPTHRQFRVLAYYGHAVLNGAMACLTLQFAYYYVLRVIEISKIRQVVNTGPFHGLGVIAVSIFVRIIIECRVNLGYLRLARGGPA